MDKNRKTTQEHWDTAWDSNVRLRVPSRLNIGVYNITSLLKKYVKENDNYIEVGCAPCKMMSWVYYKLKAKVSGIDYSQNGIYQCEKLCSSLDCNVNLYHDDFFKNKLIKSSYDIVTSFGFIEHFDNVYPVVLKHLELLKKDGIAIISIPNYGDDAIYGKIQAWCDPENLELHNTKIMNINILKNIINDNSKYDIKVYSYGKIDPWILNLDKKLLSFLVKPFNYIINFLGFLQPFHIDCIAPLLVLEIRKK